MKFQAVALVVLLAGVCGCVAMSREKVETVSTVGSSGSSPAPAAPATTDPRSLGRLDAPVAIVEYSDYQCPYCARFHAEVFPKLKRHYIDTGKVRFFFRDLPLSMHRESAPSAIAARCAAVQGKFWPMNEALFANQARIGAELYDRLGQSLQLNVDEFRQCRQNPGTRQKVLRDVSDAQRYGLQSTPSFILGRVEGDRVEIHRVARGFADFETFSREIESLLATTTTPGSQSEPGNP